MIKDGVLVDTSVLIEFFKGKSKTAEEVSELLQKNHIVITGIIIAELLQGVKNLKEELTFSELLTAAHQFELTTELWIKTGKLALSLRQKGINLPLTDVAIAILAIEHNLQIFTLDKHFEQIPNVKIYKIS